MWRMYRQEGQGGQGAEVPRRGPANRPISILVKESGLMILELDWGIPKDALSALGDRYEWRCMKDNGLHGWKQFSRFWQEMWD